MPEVSECAGQGVVPVDSAIVSADPQYAAAVAIDCPNILIAQAVRIVRVSAPRSESESIFWEARSGCDAAFGWRPRVLRSSSSRRSRAAFFS